MDIAVIGSGISGLTAAYKLSAQHRVTLFESEERLGGHTATVDVEWEGRHYAVDTGFIVYNDWTYPNFIALLDELGVPSQPTTMGFSVVDGEDDFEYCGSNFNGLFARRRNLINPRFWGMLRDILRFNREAVADLEAGDLDPAMRLGDYLEQRGYGAYFSSRYLVPMGAAIWSSGSTAMHAFPLQFFVRFFNHHGLLSIHRRPQWRVLRDGSRSYLTPLSAPFRDRIRLRTPVHSVRRDENAIYLRTSRPNDIGDNGGSDNRGSNNGVSNNGVSNKEISEEERFDQVIIATHSDQALALLADAEASEREILGALPYQDNDVLLHTDTRVLPRRRRAWASWNYRITDDHASRPVLTYNMNLLQSLDAPVTFCVTLNHDRDIDPAQVLGRYRYSHPVFSVEGIRAQQRWNEINGRRRTWFCGAYWGNGFHEDGVVSALRVCRELGVST